MEANCRTQSKNKTQVAGFVSAGRYTSVTTATSGGDFLECLGGTKCRGNQRVSRGRSRSAPTGGGVVDTQGGMLMGGGGWTIKWKLNRKKEKLGFQPGGLRPP